MLALHAPDGFLQPGTALATALLSVLVTAYCLSQSGRELQERQLPLAGISAAFVFAAQMISFPIASGSTGHLIGAALVAVLLGPATGSLVVTIVVVVQALLFADGGISALGYNVLNMAIVPAFGGYALFLMFRRILPDDAGGVVGATGLAAGLSTVLGAVAFSIEWLFGASAPVPFDTVFTAMVGVHALIGIGEGVISAMTVAAVLAARPDIVRAVADLDPLPLRGGAVSLRTFVVGAVLTTLVMAVVVSQFAVDAPDGLERVATEAGFDDRATDHALDSVVFADYATRGVDNKTLSLAIAGATGTVTVLAVGYGLARTARIGRTGHRRYRAASV